MLTHILILNSLPRVLFWNGHREGINYSKKVSHRSFVKYTKETVLSVISSPQDRFSVYLFLEELLLYMKGIHLRIDSRFSQHLFDTE